MSIINQAKSDLIAATKQQGASIVGNITGAVTGAINDVVQKGVQFLKTPILGLGGQGTENVPSGAIPSDVQSTTVTFRDAFGVQRFADTRVKIRVPLDYLTNRTLGNMYELYYLGGVVFPYTPVITYETTADYQTVTPTHSNFPINFYQRSALSAISVVGKFTVQNDKDASIYSSTIVLLRSLTKMKFGSDIGAGSPPPVCRLDAFGTDMLMNVPVAISSFRIDTPDNVDYFTYGKLYGSDDITSFPVVSTISLRLVPMYSRNEMMQFSVDNHLKSTASSKQGYV